MTAREVLPAPEPSGADLARENAELRSSRSLSDAHLHGEYLARIQDLERENTELRADRERLDWLLGSDGFDSRWSRWWRDWDGESDARAAIDSTRSAHVCGLQGFGRSRPGEPLDVCPACEERNR